MEHETRCERCGEKLNPSRTKWLELSWRTNRFHEHEGEIPGEDSQGWFPFGQACARRVLRGED